MITVQYIILPRFIKNIQTKKYFFRIAIRIYLWENSFCQGRMSDYYDISIHQRQKLTGFSELSTPQCVVGEKTRVKSLPFAGGFAIMNLVKAE
jgi:hypothetical protein